MKKLFKISGIILAILFSVVVLAIVAVTAFVDPNDYRDDISKIVKQKTGRTLTIKGDLSLQFFPWMGLSIGNTTLGNAKGFGDKPFAHLDKVELQVKLMPLFSKRIGMKKIVIAGVALDLQKNKQGRSNWDDLVAKGNRKQKTKKMAHDNEEPPSGLKGIQIGGVELINMSVSWQDRQQGKNYTLDNLNLIVGEIEPGKPVDMKLSMAVKDKTKNKTWNIKLAGILGMNPDRQEMKVEKFLLKLANLELRGAVSMSGKNHKPSFSANLQSNDFVPKETFKALGIVMPAANDATVFGKARLALQVSGTADKLKVNKLQVRLDDTTLNGTASVVMASQVIRYNLAVDQIDVDRYFPPPAKNKTEATKAAKGGDKIELPMAVLRGLNVKGSIKIGKLKASNLRSENIRISLSANKGLIRVYPASADLYKGKYQGDIRLNVQGSKPVISMNEKLSDVQAEPLFKDALDMGWISGVANLSATLKTRGDAISALQKNLNGNVTFAFTDGTIKGVNIAQKIRQASAALKGQSAPANTVEKTDFSSITGTAKVVNGVVENRDLKMQTPLLRVNGEGKVNLGMQNMSYLVKATVVATLEGQGGDALEKLKGVTVPVRIHGPFSKLEYKVELSSVLRDELKKKAKKKLENKLKDKLKGRFKGLF